MLTDQRKKIQRLDTLIRLKSDYIERMENSEANGDLLEFADYFFALQRTIKLIERLTKLIEND
jgi:hypothetical protein